ncbi:MAG TPA: hypothetical protein VG456_01260 [Candidatus Sulfopaludibacter sp.]|jgi:hypothetical protein|nr:hypothetical protein [Candidatus Sulfopaludibacter sp.]
MRYDPLKDPDPEEWLELDEALRIKIVEDYHRRKRIRMPSVRAHAAIQAVVETQIAMGRSHPAKAVLRRLMLEGLDRHDAVHAIGSVLAAQMYEMMTSGSSDNNQEYERKLSELTAASWLKSGG